MLCLHFNFAYREPHLRRLRRHDALGRLQHRMERQPGRRHRAARRQGDRRQRTGGDRARHGAGAPRLMTVSGRDAMNRWLLRPRVMAGIAAGGLRRASRCSSCRASPAASAPLRRASPARRRSTSGPPAIPCRAYWRRSAGSARKACSTTRPTARSTLVFPWLLCALGRGRDAAAGRRAGDDVAVAGGDRGHHRKCAAARDPADPRRPLARAGAMGQCRDPGQVLPLRPDARHASGRRGPRVLAAPVGAVR